MCGIAGVLRLREQEDAAEPRVLAMLRAMKHRGPDGQGTMSFPGGAAGMVRLALVDLSPRGQQPLRSPDGKVAILFNGEMYNFREKRAALESAGHRFETTTDTEVVLHLYLEHGASFVDHVRGMFALAILDGRVPQGSPPEVLLARGPLGMKPLYIAEPRGPRGPLVFASELRSVLASGLVERRVDPEALEDLLSLGCVLQPRTMLAGVRALRPGTIERYRDGELVEVRTWWDLQRVESAAPRSFAESAAELRALLAESIRLHSLADAPVGAFMSGGVDSTAIVAMMRPHVSDLHTFTLRFPDERDQDEADVALEVARALGCQAHVVDVTGAQVLRDFPRFASELDQPSSDGLNTWLVSRAASAHVKAALSGLGGDEWFSGYPTALRMHRLGAGSRGRMLRSVARVAGLLLPSLPDGRLTNRVANLAARRSPADLWMHGHAVFSEKDLAGLGRGAGGAAGAHAAASRQAEALLMVASGAPTAHLAPADLAMLLDVRIYLLCQLLRDSDATAMAHSLEVRAPLVDVEIARFAQRCPVEYRLALDGPRPRQKRVFVEAVADLLPAGVLSRPKRGFTLPYARWITGALRPLAQETTSPEVVRARGLLAPSAVAELWERAGRGNARAAYPQLWTLMTFELWCRAVLDQPITASTREKALPAA